MEMKMDSKVAIVTGGAQGIGLGIATALYEKGYRVAVLDLDATALASSATGFSDKDRFLSLQVDITSSEQLNAVVSRVTTRWKAVDVLVNNAGLERDRRIQNMTEEDWDLVMNVNLRAQFLCVKAVVDGMLAQNYGRIINISSRAWLGGFGQANYSAAKGGVVSFTRTLAIELAARGITANTIAPGLIQTPMLDLHSEETKEKLKSSVPLKRLGQPSEVANAALFFASEASSYITGQTLYVCGGRSLSSVSV
jgi:3-oxoacyl-[acyl-carrier protein] reductase